MQSIFMYFQKNVHAEQDNRRTLHDLFTWSGVIPLRTVAVLGINLHDLYTPGSAFQGLYRNAKPNMYPITSYTTVIGPNGTPFEIQIRTSGNAQNCRKRYRDTGSTQKVSSGKTDMDSKLEWVRQLLDTREKYYRYTISLTHLNSTCLKKFSYLPTR